MELIHALYAPLQNKAQVNSTIGGWCQIGIASVFKIGKSELAPPIWVRHFGSQPG